MGRFRRLFGRGGDEDADQKGTAEGRGANTMTQSGEQCPAEPAKEAGAPDHWPAPPAGAETADSIAAAGADSPIAVRNESPGSGDTVTDGAPDAGNHIAAADPTTVGTAPDAAGAYDAPAANDVVGYDVVGSNVVGTDPVESSTATANTPAAPSSLDTPRHLDADRRLGAPPISDVPTEPATGAESVSVPAEGTTGAEGAFESPDPTTSAESVPEPTSAAPSAEPVPEPEAPSSSWLVAGSKVGNRYTVVRELTLETATDLLGSPPPVSNATLYAVDDRMGYERCWSCGSTNNDQSKRFCVDCGAPQHREAVLARTLTATGLAEEFQEAGSYYHVVHPRKQFGSTGVSLEFGAFSAEGPHHPNEDSYWTGLIGGCYDSRAESVGVIVLADGMGGYAPGSGLISKAIVTIIGRGIFDLIVADPNIVMDEDSLRAIVHGAIATANAKVLDEIKIHGDMGATLVAAIVCGQTAYIANIGDSRAYYLSASGAVAQITRDQSLVEQQVALGQLSPDAVYTAIGNNVILHAVGEEQVEDVFDWYEQPLEPGSHLMLCSDGYWKTMQHAVWDVETAAKQPTLHSLARTMVENALANNTDDNTTVLLVGID